MHDLGGSRAGQSSTKGGPKYKRHRDGESGGNDGGRGGEDQGVEGRNGPRRASSRPKLGSVQNGCVGIRAPRKLVASIYAILKHNHTKSSSQKGDGS